MAKFLFLVLLVSLFTTVALQNMEPINLKLLFWELVQLPKLYLLAATYFAGILTGILLLKLPAFKASRRPE